MLKLRTQRPIRGRARPVIRPHLLSIRPQVNHRLDREAHPGLGDSGGPVLSVMGDVWSAVEEVVDAVSAIGFHDRAITGFGMFFNDVAGVAT